MLLGINIVSVCVIEAECAARFLASIFLAQKGTGLVVQPVFLQVMGPGCATAKTGFIGQTTLGHFSSTQHGIPYPFLKSP